MSEILVTGAAGFIGFHLAHRLLARGERVLGIDNLNDYYDVGLKRARLAQLEEQDGFRFERCDLADRQAIGRLFEEHPISAVAHMGAQAGVRYSLENPHAYVDSNLTGFANILEGCRSGGVGHLVYASSSSVYGGNRKQPFSEHQGADHPYSLYGATKRANELMAHSYSHLYGLPATGLRFFTVYGPWGRPDMAPFLFTRAILAGEPIDVYNEGRHSRDFTYIDDVVEGVVRVLDQPARPAPDWDPARPDPAASAAPWRLYNVGTGRPVGLDAFIGALESTLGRKAKRRLLAMQPGDVPSTWADISDLAAAVGYRPATPLSEGVSRFVRWYRQYYGG